MSPDRGGADAAGEGIESAAADADPEDVDPADVDVDPITNYERGDDPGREKLTL